MVIRLSSMSDLDTTEVSTTYPIPETVLRDSKDVVDVLTLSSFNRLVRPFATISASTTFFYA